MEQILQCLKENGELLDAELAAAAGLSLKETRDRIQSLAEKGKVMTYPSTRILEGQRIVGIRCRLAVHTRPAKSGRRPLSA